MKTSLAISILLVIIIAGGAVFFFGTTERGSSLLGPLGNFFPVGGDGGTDTPENIAETPDDPLPENSEEKEGVALRYRKITDRQIVGYAAISDQGGERLRYLERGTGHVYDYDLLSREESRVSNKTVTRVQEVFWGENGESFIVRYVPDTDGAVRNLSFTFSGDVGDSPRGALAVTKTLKEGDRGSDVMILQKILNMSDGTRVTVSGPGSPGSETIHYGPLTRAAVKKFQALYAAELGTAETTGVLDERTRGKVNEIAKNEYDKESGSSEGVESETALETVELPATIRGITISPRGNRIFYIAQEDDSAIGRIADMGNKGVRQIYRSAFGEWLLSWPREDTITLTTKPSESVPGHLYFLNASSGTLASVLKDIPGLTSLVDPRSLNVIYSEKAKTGNGFFTYFFDRVGRTTSILPIQTLPEKCAWSSKTAGLIYCGVPDNLPSGEYPDSWYRGEVRFSDSVWGVNVATGEHHLIWSPREETLSENIDLIAPLLDSGEGTLFFMNKRDASLWALDLD